MQTTKTHRGRVGLALAGTRLTRYFTLSNRMLGKSTTLCNFQIASADRLNEPNQNQFNYLTISKNFRSMGGNSREGLLTAIANNHYKLRETFITTC